MAISIDWGTRVITIPQADLTPLGGTLYELNANTFRLWLKDLEDDTAGMSFPDTHRHNTEVTIAGITYARTVEIINGYTVTFQDGQYRVNIIGANNNITDVLNLNQVSVVPSNSAGLQSPRLLNDIETDTQDIQSRLPAALVSGRMDSDVGAMQNATIQAATYAAGAVDAASIATDAINEIADGFLDRAGAVDGLTPRNLLATILASAAGRLSGAGGATITISNPDGTQTRITATTTAEGNRTSVALFHAGV